MHDALHDLRSAAAALRRLDQKSVLEADAGALARLAGVIDKHGESFARVIRIGDFLEKAVSAESETQQAHATGGAIASFVALAKLTGVSQLAKFEAVTRASDALGVESPDAFLHKPGSNEDGDETVDLAGTPEGRAFVLEVMAQHLSLFPFGVAAHGALQAQIGLMNLAARGRSIWPEPVNQERIKTNSGRQHAWEALIAYEGGMAQQIADHFGLKISVESSLALALAEYAKKVGTEPPDYVSIPALLQRIQKERDGMARLFRFGSRRMAVILRKSPMLPDEIRRYVEKIT